jgi:hypothetical protein
MKPSDIALIWLVISAILSGPVLAGVFIGDTQAKTVADELTAQYGPAEKARIERCVKQVADLWRQEDGDAEQFAAFCRENYIADPKLRQETVNRYETALESIYGHLGKTGRDLSWNLDVETGPILPIDYFFARYSPGAHLSEDFFQTKIAFVGLLNFPVYTLNELLTLGPTWTRDEWAQARLADDFANRVPPEVSQKIQEAYVSAGEYISHYNIWMYHLLTPDGKRPFPKGKKLITHWNLRDELKAQYAEPDGIPKQEMIYDVMLKIIHQTIPAAVIDNPAVDWKLAANQVVISPEVDGDVPASWKVPGKPGETVPNTAEADDRYRKVLEMFQAFRASDPYYPATPTLIQRRFDLNREIPEAQVEQMLVSVLSSPAVAKTARLIEKRLDRKLKPYDIWYAGFKPRQEYGEAELDKITRAKYPTVQVFRDDLPRILRDMGFDEPTTAFLVSHITVDACRGIGHASGPAFRGDSAHLRTRVPATGMDFKGYNIAIHEFGHNVEQVLSLERVDNTLLSGVPNTGFTEGLAFVFQSRDLQLLGLQKTDAQADLLKTLDLFWGTCEISAVSLVDMKIWHWLYNHPDATPAQLKEAVITIARDVWNQYFAPVFGIRDVEILAIYSHIIDSALYLPDYALGSIIAYQVEDYLKRSPNMGREITRMYTQGSVTPDLWMKQAVGSSLSAQPLIQAADQAAEAMAK